MKFGYQIPALLVLTMGLSAQAATLTKISKMNYGELESFLAGENSRLVKRKPVPMQRTDKLNFSGTAEPAEPPGSTGIKVCTFLDKIILDVTGSQALVGWNGAYVINVRAYAFACIDLFPDFFGLRGRLGADAAAFCTGGRGSRGGDAGSATVLAARGGFANPVRQHNPSARCRLFPQSQAGTA